MKTNKQPVLLALFKQMFSSYTKDVTAGHLIKGGAILISVATTTVAWLYMQKICSKQQESPNAIVSCEQLHGIP